MHFKSLECSAVFGNKGGSTEMLNWSEIFHFYSRNWQLAWSTLLTTVARLLIFVYSTHSSEGDVFRGSYVRHFFSVLFVDLTVCVCSLMVVASWQWSCKPVHGQEHSMFFVQATQFTLSQFCKNNIKILYWIFVGFCPDDNWSIQSKCQCRQVIFRAQFGNR